MGKVVRKYILLLSGVLENDEGLIQEALLSNEKGTFIDAGAKIAKTKYKVLERFRGYTLVEACPLTFIKWQMRAHFWHLGNPLAIDEIYASARPILLSSFKRKYKVKLDSIEKPLIDRLTLHCGEISFDGKTFNAPLPKDFEITLKHLRKYYK
jgi:23S rRNA pseudouridine955/2504/2580 synthase/23S rRNA pseudouridine1911/1915/1917 synthase